MFNMINFVVHSKYYVLNLIPVTCTKKIRKGAYLPFYCITFSLSVYKERTPVVVVLKKAILSHSEPSFSGLEPSLSYSEDTLLRCCMLLHSDPCKVN